MRISDWSSDVCSSDLGKTAAGTQASTAAVEAANALKAVAKPVTDGAAPRRDDDPPRPGCAGTGKESRSKQGLGDLNPGWQEPPSRLARRQIIMRKAERRLAFKQRKASRAGAGHAAEQCAPTGGKRRQHIGYRRAQGDRARLKIVARPDQSSNGGAAVERTPGSGENNTE